MGEEESGWWVPQKKASWILGSLSAVEVERSAEVGLRRWKREETETGGDGGRSRSGVLLEVLEDEGESAGREEVRGEDWLKGGVEGAREEEVRSSSEAASSSSPQSKSTHSISHPARALFSSSSIARFLHREHRSTNTLTTALGTLANSLRIRSSSSSNPA